MSSAGDTIGRPVRSRLIPSTISDAAAWSCVGAAAVWFAIIALGGTVLGDPDTQWHIAVGQWIAANGRLPQTDTMSHTFADQPWIAKEWLSQVLLMAAHTIGGWTGVVVLTASTVAYAHYLIMVHCGRINGPAWGLLVGMATFVFVGPTIVARPHALVFPVIVLWTLALQKGSETGRPPWRALPLLILWANMHAGFTIGVLIAAALGLDAVLRSSRENRLVVIGRWALFGVACLVATIMTPYGIQPLLLNASMAVGSEARDRIGEWQPLAATPASALLLLMAGFCIFALAQRPREHAARLLLLLVLSYAMIKYTRFTMLFGLVAPVLAGPAVFALAEKTARRLNVFQHRMLPANRVAPHLSSGFAVFSAAVAILQPPLLQPSIAPAAALASVSIEVRMRPVFNSYDFGGFLVLNGVRTFIDGRTDQLFLGGFMANTMSAAASPEPRSLEQLLDKHGVVWALTKADAPESLLFPRLASWRLHYRDDFAHVFVREEVPIRP